MAWILGTLLVINLVLFLIGFVATTRHGLELRDAIVDAGMGDDEIVFFVGKPDSLLHVIIDVILLPSSLSLYFVYLIVKKGLV